MTKLKKHLMKVLMIYTLTFSKITRGPATPETVLYSALQQIIPSLIHKDQVCFAIKAHKASL